MASEKPVIASATAIPPCPCGPGISSTAAMTPAPTASSTATSWATGRPKPTAKTAAPITATSAHRGRLNGLATMGLVIGDACGAPYAAYVEGPGIVFICVLLDAASGTVHAVCHRSRYRG